MYLYLISNELFIFTIKDFPISAKWPNDVIHADEKSKLCGTLVESFRFGDNETILSIGCGLNVCGINNFKGIFELLDQKANESTNKADLKNKLLIKLIENTCHMVWKLDSDDYVICFFFKYQYPYN